MAWRSALLACLAMLAAPAAPAMAQYEAARRIAAAERLLSVQPGAEGLAWRDLSRGAGPLVEPHPFRPDLVRITFLLRAPRDAAGVRLDSVINRGLARQPVEDYERDFTLPLARIADSRLWALTLEAPAQVEAVYSFLVDTPAGTNRRPDPLNRRALGGGSAESLLLVSPGPAQRWSAPRSARRMPEAERFAFDSSALGREVRIELHRPAEARPDAPVLILYDSFIWGVRAPVAAIAANLAEAGEIEPVTVVLIDQLDPQSAARAYADQADFIAGELLPALRERGVGAGPVLLGGASRRGLAAALTALARPDAVDAAISLSGSFYWSPAGEAPQWLARTLPAPGEIRPRFHLAAGALETVETSTNQGHVMLSANRAMALALEEAGYPVELAVYPGGHDAAGWRGALAEALIALLGDGED